MRDVNTGRDLADTVKWVKFSGISWTHDNKGFFYSRYGEPTSGNKMTNTNRNHKLYYHRVGRPQSRDDLVYDRPDQPDWLFDGTVTDDGQYLVITVSQGTDVRTRLYLIDLDNPGKPQIDNPVFRLIDKLDAEYSFVGNRGTNFYVRTDRNAPKGRIVSISIDNPREERWNTIVPESKDALIGASMAGDDIVGNYLQDAHSSVRFFTGSRNNQRDQRPRGQPQQQPRNPGSIYDDTSTAPISTRERSSQSLGGGFTPHGELRCPASERSANPRAAGDDRLFTFTSFLPDDYVPLRSEDAQNSVFKRPRYVRSLTLRNAASFHEQDGTRVPCSSRRRRASSSMGPTRRFLYAYVFNISSPSFSAAKARGWNGRHLYRTESPGGGGTERMAWRGCSRKANVFDDFRPRRVPVKESTHRLEAHDRSGSNGGLLVRHDDAASTYSAHDIARSRLMDMLRFQKFTIRWAWTSVTDPRTMPTSSSICARLRSRTSAGNLVSPTLIHGDPTTRSSRPYVQVRGDVRPAQAYAIRSS